MNPWTLARVILKLLTLLPDLIAVGEKIVAEAKEKEKCAKPPEPETKPDQEPKP